MSSPKKYALVWLFLLAALCAFGQNVPGCQRPVIATVIDSQGSAPSGLTREDFTITYKGQTAHPIAATYTKRPRRVVALLDVSASMKGYGPGEWEKWEVARASAWEFFAALPLGSKASLMTFSEKTEVQTALSPDLRPIQTWLNSETARRPESFNGRTALYAAVQSAVAQLQPAEPGDAIYVITDGGENASRISKSRVEDALRSVGVRLFALIVPQGVFVGEQDRVGLSELLDMSKHSGGFVKLLGASGDAPLSTRLVPYDSRMKEQVEVYSQRLRLAIEAFYSLTLQLPENSDKPLHLDINVVDGRGHNRKDLLLTYPRELPPCRVESAQR